MVGSVHNNGAVVNPVAIDQPVKPAKPPKKIQKARELFEKRAEQEKAQLMKHDIKVKPINVGDQVRQPLNDKRVVVSEDVLKVKLQTPEERAKNVAAQPTPDVVVETQPQVQSTVTVVQPQPTVVVAQAQEKSPSIATTIYNATLGRFAKKVDAVAKVESKPEAVVEVPKVVEVEKPKIEEKKAEAKGRSIYDYFSCAKVTRRVKADKPVETVVAKPVETETITADNLM